MHSDFVSHHPYFYFIVLLIAFVALVSLITKRRLKKEYHLLSNENPLEAFAWALLLGAMLCLLVAAWFPYCMLVIDGLGISTVYAGSIVTTLFVGPSAMLLVYWRRLDDVRDKVQTGIGMLASDKLTERVAALYYLEKIAKESTTFFPTVLEILCAHTRSRDLSIRTDANVSDLVRTMEIKQCVDIISRLWFYNINKRGSLWNYSVNLRPDLKLIDLSSIHLRYSNLSNFYLFRTNFSGCNLTAANLCAAYLDEADLTHAELNDTCACNARFNNANMLGASMKGVLLFGAEMDRSLNLKQEQLEEAIGNHTTKIPAKLTRPKSWENEATAHFKCPRSIQCGRKCCRMRLPEITPP